MTLHVAVAGCCIKCAYSRSSLFQWFNLQFCRLGSTLPMQNLCFAGKILNWIQWSSLIEIGKSIGLKKTRNYSPPLESSISIWLINLAKKLTWGENRWFLDGKLPIFKKQGAQGGPAIVPMNSLNQFNNIQWRIHDLLGSFFQTHLKVKLGYGDMGLRAFPFQVCVRSMKRWWKGNIACSWNWTMMLADVYGQEEGCDYNIMSGYRFWRCL
jgi:hypothetical protein